jgi:hypothetical protein
MPRVVGVAPLDRFRISRQDLPALPFGGGKNRGNLQVFYNLNYNSFQKPVIGIGFSPGRGKTTVIATEQEEQPHFR